MLSWNKSQLGQQDASTPVWQICHVDVPVTQPVVRDVEDHAFFVHVRWIWDGQKWREPIINPVLRLPRGSPTMPCGIVECGPPWEYVQLYVAVNTGGEYAEWALAEYAYNYSDSCSDCFRCT